MRRSPCIPVVTRARTITVAGLLSAAAAIDLVGVGSTSTAAASATTVVIGEQATSLTQPSDPGIGVLTPSSEAARQGMFGPQIDWPLVPIHAALARNGHLVTFGTPLHQASQDGMVYDDWIPEAASSDAAHVDSPSMGDYDSFCNSLVGLGDGRLLMVGGNSAMSSMVYDPASGETAMGADLHQQRWYATAIRTEDGRILVLGGGNSYKTPTSSSEESDRVALTPEIGDGTGTWTELTGATSSALFGLDDGRWWYPRAFNSIDGTVVGLSSNRIWRLDPTGSGAISQIGELPYDPKVSGSEVMYAPGRVLIAGGGQNNPEDDLTGTDEAIVLDLSGTTPSSATTSSMHHGRNWLNLTVLPTGEVLANGGTTVGTESGEQNSVKQAELWHPESGEWTLAATAQRTRTYHSTAVLLPSGAVFTGGGGVPGPEDNLNAELYYPPSLFTTQADGTVVWASRPEISSIAGSATYGGSVSLGIADGRRIASASLITLPSVTHSQDTDQRRIPLTVTQAGGTVTAALPDDQATMPEGDYELTVVDAEGVPSPAQIITVRDGAAGLVTLAPTQDPPGATAPSGPATSAPSASPAPTGTAPSSEPIASAAPTSAPEPTPAPTTSPAPPVLKIGSAVGLAPTTREGVRFGRSGSGVVLRRATTGSPRSTRRATSWIVRKGLASSAAVSFESMDRPGWFLVAPIRATGAATVAKRSKRASFAVRATFTTVTGAAGTGISFHLTAHPEQFLRTSGSALAVGTLGDSKASRTSGTFVVPKALASR